MPTVKVSPKYQIVIPKEIRKHIDLRPGQEVSVILLDGQIAITPIRKASDLRGFLRGQMDSRIAREPDREL